MKEEGKTPFFDIDLVGMEPVAGNLPESFSKYSYTVFTNINEKTDMLFIPAFNSGDMAQIISVNAAYGKIAFLYRDTYHEGGKRLSGGSPVPGSSPGMRAEIFFQRDFAIFQ